MHSYPVATMEDLAPSIRLAARDRSSLHLSFNSEHRIRNKGTIGPAASLATVGGAPVVSTPPSRKAFRRLLSSILQANGLRIWRPYLASTPHLTFNQAIRYLAGFHNPLNSGQLMGVQFASAVAGGLLLFGRLSRREEMGASPVNGTTAFRKLKNRVVMARVHASEGVTQDDEHS